VVLTGSGFAYFCRFHHVPAPKLPARTAAVFAIAAVLVGVITLSTFWTAAMAICLIIANLWHLAVAWRRAVSKPEVTVHQFEYDYDRAGRPGMLP
jgi:membrane protein implicated in regulation of membrane protease activity